MSQLALFIDAPTLSEATAVYTDAALTVLAVDGYYSDQVITRQQSGGVLGSSINCPNCSGSTPSPPTIYSVIQNVTNNIVGTLNVDYTLSGTGYDGNDPAGSVTQTGQENDPYSFNIVASPVQGKQFSPTAKFSATNPAGSIPVGGATVTNTLSGTIEIIPSAPATINYKLTACQGENGNTPASGYINRTFANAPAANQRFVATNVEPEEYYYYDPASPTVSFVPAADYLDQPGGRNLVLNEIVGETGCPTFNVITGNIVQLTKCSDGSTDYYMQVPWNTLWATNKRVTPDLGSTIYTMGGILLASQLSGKQELTNVLPIDVNGVVEGQPGFYKEIVGCPAETYYILKPCDPSLQTGNQYGGKRVSTLPTNDPLFSAGAQIGNSGSVYRGDDGVCYQLDGSTTTPSQYITNTTPAVEPMLYLGNDCQVCNQIGSGSSSSYVN